MIKNPIIRTIYLYMFSLLGLVLLTIGCVRFIDMGLKAFVFTKAEQEERLYIAQPPITTSLERMKELEQSESLATDDKEQLRQIIKDYEAWQEKADQIDPVTSRRHRDAAFNLSLIIVGLPLYLYHWLVIRRETKKA